MDIRDVARKGGQARAKNMTAKQRSKSAAKAAKARWAKGRINKRRKGISK